MSENQEVKKLREKMNSKTIDAPISPTEELPSMEATPKNEEEAQKLREKSDNGAVGVVKKVMEQPEVQGIIKKNINKQTFISGLFMAFLLIGFLEVSQAVKQIFNYTWQFDLVAGIIMITVGAIYMIKEVALGDRQKK